MNRQNSPVPLIIVILAALVIFMLTSCVENGTTKDPFAAEQEAYSQELDSTSQYNDRDYTVYTLEGCEYILVGAGNGRWGSHKGNCKNQIHKENASN